jgi:hypothetical protein
MNYEGVKNLAKQSREREGDILNSVTAVHGESAGMAAKISYEMYLLMTQMLAGILAGRSKDSPNHEVMLMSVAMLEARARDAHTRMTYQLLATCGLSDADQMEVVKLISRANESHAHFMAMATKEF